MLFDPVAVVSELRKHPDLMLNDDLYVYSYDVETDVLYARGIAGDCELEIRVRKNS